jgi:hypothetical protein
MEVVGSAEIEKWKKNPGGLLSENFIARRLVER